jgi:hypothetical protein
MMDGCSFQIKNWGLLWWCFQYFWAWSFWLYTTTQVLNNLYITLILLPHDDWTVNSMPANQFKKLKNAQKKKEEFFLFIWRNGNFPPELLSGVPQFSLLFQQKKKCFVGQSFTYTYVTQDSQKVARNNRMLSHYFFSLHVSRRFTFITRRTSQKEKETLTMRSLKNMANVL